MKVTIKQTSEGNYKFVSLGYKMPKELFDTIGKYSTGMKIVVSKVFTDINKATTFAESKGFLVV